MKYIIAITALAIIVSIIGIYLIESWRISAGVLLLMWGNNISNNGLLKMKFQVIFDALRKLNATI